MMFVANPYLSLKNVESTHLLVFQTKKSLISMCDISLRRELFSQTSLLVIAVVIRGICMWNSGNL